MVLKLDNKQIELVNIWYQYLYSYLVRFAVKQGIWKEYWKGDTIFIPNEKKEDFKKCLEDALEELLSECYVEPTQKQRTKHPGAFEKIIFKEKKYIINYRTDVVGIIAFGINSIINRI